MKPIFKIYKEGVTSEWITILLPLEDYSHEAIEKKANKYIYLGYSLQYIF